MRQSGKKAANSAAWGDPARQQQGIPQERRRHSASAQAPIKCSVPYYKPYFSCPNRCGLISIILVTVRLFVTP